jgi:hypothetical protein
LLYALDKVRKEASEYYADGHTNVIDSDGLLTSESMMAKSGNDSFDYIIVFQWI